MPAAVAPHRRQEAPLTERFLTWTEQHEMIGDSFNSVFSKLQMSLSVEIFSTAALILTVPSVPPEVLHGGVRPSVRCPTKTWSKWPWLLGQMDLLIGASSSHQFGGRSSTWTLSHRWMDPCLDPLLLEAALPQIIEKLCSPSFCSADLPD